jgi:divalent metal cation (Fe/Co/Zn/Cd) transporter
MLPETLKSTDVARLRRRGFILEGITLGWNVVGVVVLAVASITAWSVALAGFGLDSLVEIGASTVVIWELSGAGEQRQRFALTLIAWAFLALALYLVVQSGLALATGHHALPSPAGIAWTAVTAVVMFVLAAGKAATGKALGNPVLIAEGRVTFIDGLLATAVLAGILLDTVSGWWWADPVAGLVIVYYAIHEALTILRHPHSLR